MSNEAHTTRGLTTTCLLLVLRLAARMLTAIIAVWNMQGASHDIWAVNTDFEYHEAQKIEIHHRGAVTAGR